MKTVVLCKVNIFIMLFFYFSMIVRAQDPYLSLSNIGICNTQSVLVPLTGSNLSNIGSMTLYIGFDDQSLSFDTIENIAPQLKNGLMFNLLPNPSRVAIVWSSVTGTQIQDLTLLNLKFNVLQQTGNISFAPGCEIADLSLHIIPVNYINGSVYPTIPIISVEPQNRTIKSQANAVFEVISPNATEFTWQESHTGGIIWMDLTDGATYTGAHTATVTINSVPTQFNKYAYRCILKNENCPAITSQATLSVDSVSGINDHPLIESLLICNKPNPFTESTTIEYQVPEQGFVSIRIFTLSGKCMVNIVDEYKKKGMYTIENNFVSLPTGLYLCQYAFNNRSNVFVTRFKMMKINKN